MCEDPGSKDSKTLLQKLEHILQMNYQKNEGRLNVDKNYAFFKGKAVAKKTWRQQAFEHCLPADDYLEIMALAGDNPGEHRVSYEKKGFVVDVGEIVDSTYGGHRMVKSVTPYKC
jgi:hypothetical protein